MRKRSSVISWMLFLAIIFNVILPVNEVNAVFAYSPLKESVAEAQGNYGDKADNIEGELPGGETGETGGGTSQNDSQEEKENISPEDNVTGETGEEVIPEEDNTNVEPSDKEIEDTENSKDNGELEETNDNSSQLESENEVGVLDGELLDNPISTWSFSGVEDFNRDGIIDQRDLAFVSDGYNTQKGQSGYVATKDLNGDGIIDIYDMVRVANKIGTRAKIVIDPGHGGKDPGAIGPSGLQEKDVVLKVALKVRDLLESYGYTVIMTRTTDVYLSLQERCDIANNNDADLFISIHNNSFSDPSANGTETFSYLPNDEGGQVAKLMQSKLIEALGLRNRGHKTADFYVLRNTKMPAVLTELAFISNPKEEALLKTDEFQTKSAKAIVDSIIGF